MGKGKSCPRSQWQGQKPLSGKSQLQLEPRPCACAGPPSNPPCAPGLSLTWMTPPACHRASRSGPPALAPPRRLPQKSAAACGWRPPSGRRARGPSRRPRRRRPRHLRCPDARRRSWSASAGRCWCRARLQGRESAEARGWEVLPRVSPRSLLLQRNLRSSSWPLGPHPVSPAHPLRSGRRGHSQADGVRGRDRRSGSSWDADLASLGSGP